MSLKNLFKTATSSHPAKSTTELELEKRIKNEVTDARKLYTNRWIFSINIFGQDTVHEFYQSSTHFFVNDLYTIKAEFLENSYVLQQYQHKLYHYINPEAERPLKLNDLQSLVQTSEQAQKQDLAAQNESGTNGEFPEQKVEFTKLGSAPKSYVKEAQHYESQVSYGVHYADLNLKKAEENYKIEKIELPYRAIDVTDIPKPGHNILLSVTKQKLILMYAVITGAIIPEFITFSKLLSGVFHIESGFKQFFLGFTIVLLSKVFSILLFGTLLEFVKRQNKILQLRNIIVNKFALFLAVMGISLCVSLGALYYQVSERDILTQKMIMLQRSNRQIKEEAAISETPLDDESKQIIHDNAEKINLCKKRLEEMESGTVLKIITISLFSAVVVLFSSSLFAFAWMFSTVLYLKNRVEKLSSKIHQLEGRFNSQKTGLKTFQKKIYNIFRLLGELEYLRRVREKFSEDFTVFDVAANTGTISTGNEAQPSETKKQEPETENKEAELSETEHKQIEKAAAKSKKKLIDKTAAKQTGVLPLEPDDKKYNAVRNGKSYVKSTK
ncbi:MULTISPECIES: hypothetical protein [unclassified Chryseobacterium]|uniref:hypothetical protein n=1 Tax=unclassified Chryseobacterium TaxID=2593645 RepID=UPI000D371B57|nr:MULTISPECIES: hypothetical protein [unclassified Chryseobacterium]PTT72593.1 hypothetical protein DBR25_14320 [Chryseobacterium sp. HMWF001]PVV50414.1 hypothetical protein DD829_22380 [Chryseobacterium sp. HMWF035]